MENKVRLSIYSCQYYLKLEQRGGGKLKAIKSLDESRIILQNQIKSIQEKGEGDCKNKLFLLYEVMNLMGQFFNSLKNFDLATICFNSVNNVCSVIESYNKWIQNITSQIDQINKNSQNIENEKNRDLQTLQKQKNRQKQLKRLLYQVYSKYGSYCCQHSQSQLGMRQLQLAYKYASNYDELYKISDKIYLAKSQSKTYLKNMADKAFCQELTKQDQKLIFNMYRDEQLPSRIKESTINIQQSNY